MKILIDIGHPAHVHYFRNFIFIMQQKGHEFLVTARDKEVTFQLLNAYNIPYTSRGKGGKGLIGKLLYILKGDYLIYKAAKKFNPGLFLSFGSPYASQVSKLFRKPHIAFDDTEHAIFEHLMYAPFTNTILTPNSFFKYFGSKQIKFNGFMELCALHPNYFKPNEKILSEIGISKTEKIILLRFVSWEASHDAGRSGLIIEFKIKLVNSLLKYGKVFISAEGKLPDELEKYRLKFSPEKIHDLLYFISLYIGESATMASEAAVLGTPAIYLDDVGRGYTDEEEKKYSLVFNYTASESDQLNAIEKAVELLNTPNLKEQWQQKRQKMLADKIDVTAFMVWFVENYPESVRVMKENPVETQKRFM